jgi:FKBP-type peptidyl-prolyl cis-trans isomerase
MEDRIMKGILMTVLCLLLASPVVAQESTGALKTQKEKISYFIGTDMGRRMKAELEKQSIDFDPAIVAQAVKDALAGKKSLLSDAEIEEVRSTLQKELSEKNQARTKALAEKNKKEGEAFLIENRKREGVKTTDSGLQFKVLKQGKGKIPQQSDTVTVNYVGTFVDGTEFDSSVKRGKPATFALNQVVSGWTEALTMMPAGSKWQIVLPPKLAYGSIGTPGGPIGPNAVLIFEIELVSVQDAKMLNLEPSPAAK